MPARLPWLSMGAEVILALVGLGGTGVAALWKIANGLGRFEARTGSILEHLQRITEDHEDRLRDLESRRIIGEN